MVRGYNKDLEVEGNGKNVKTDQIQKFIFIMESNSEISVFLILVLQYQL